MSEQLVGLVGRGIVPADTPLVTADDLGLTRGDGCFDATRVVTSPEGVSTVDHLDRHLERFRTSQAGLDFPDFDDAGWRALIAEMVDAWQVPGEATLKLMWTRGQESSHTGPTGLATITPLGASALADREGLRVCCLQRGTSSTLHDNLPWLLGGVKSLSYAINVAAKREATRRACGDALFVTTDGYCLEAPTASLVVMRDSTLVTTPIEGTGILRSITQTLLWEAAEREGVPTRYELLTPMQVVAADAAWLVSSVRGLAPITELDARAVKQDAELTARLRGWIGF